MMLCLKPYDRIFIDAETVKQFNSLPNDKFLDWPKLKAFADDKINVTWEQKLVENIVGKGENTGYQHFLLFPQCFQNVSFLGS